MGIETTKDALRYLSKRFSHIGQVIVIRSAKRDKAFKRGHDFDIHLRTDFPSKHYLIDRIQKVSEDWFKCMGISLHVFVVGNFSIEMRVEDHYRIHFTGPFSKNLLWLKILW